MGGSMALPNASTYPRDHKEREPGQHLEVGGGPINKCRLAWRREMREALGMAQVQHTCASHRRGKKMAPRQIPSTRGQEHGPRSKAWTT